MPSPRPTKTAPNSIPYAASPPPRLAAYVLPVADHRAAGGEGAEDADDQAAHQPGLADELAALR